MEKLRGNSFSQDTPSKWSVATRYAISRVMYTAVCVQLAPPTPFVLRTISPNIWAGGDSSFRGFLTSRSWFRLPLRRNPFRGWTIFMGDGEDTSGNSGRIRGLILRERCRWYSGENNYIPPVVHSISRCTDALRCTSRASFGALSRHMC